MSDSEPVPRVALRPEEAAESLGISRSLFDRRVLPNVRVVRVGRLKLVGVDELEKWVERNGAVLLDDELTNEGGRP